jgi:hypothetical protein
VVQAAICDANFLWMKHPSQRRCSSRPRINQRTIETGVANREALIRVLQEFPRDVTPEVKASIEATLGADPYNVTMHIFAQAGHWTNRGTSSSNHDRPQLQRRL